MLIPAMSASEKHGGGPATAMGGTPDLPGVHVSCRLSAESGRRPQRGDGEGAGAAVSNRGHAAIDWEVHACDEACFVRRKEQGGRRDLLRAAEPPERDRRGE